MMIGVNGVGKTTTIAKLAHRDIMRGKKVLIAAGDTFRAAAIEQLEIWAKRVGATFYAKGEGSDPAAELAETDRQIETAKAEIADLQRNLAEHTVEQIRLKTLESQATSIFNDIARTERQTLAALGVASGAEGQDRPVGLNRMTTETYATEDRGLLGKKGRVLLVTVLAFMLSAAYAYVRHDGLPRFRAWMEALEAADKRKGK